MLIELLGTFFFRPLAKLVVRISLPVILEDVVFDDETATRRDRLAPPWILSLLGRRNAVMRFRQVVLAKPSHLL